MKGGSSFLNFPNLNLDSYDRLGRRHNPPPPPQPATLSNIGYSHDSSGRNSSGRRIIGYVANNPTNLSSSNNNSSKSSDWFPYGRFVNPPPWKYSVGNPCCRSTMTLTKNGDASYNRLGYARPASKNQMEETKRISKTAKVLRSSYFQTPKLALGCHVRLGESDDSPVIYLTNAADEDKDKKK